MLSKETHQISSSAIFASSRSTSRETAPDNFRYQQRSIEGDDPHGAAPYPRQGIGFLNAVVIFFNAIRRDIVNHSYIHDRCSLKMKAMVSACLTGFNFRLMMEIDLLDICNSLN